MQTLSLRCLAVAPCVLRHMSASRRVRLDSPEIIGSPALAAKVERELIALDGVTKAVADPETGRLLIIYAPKSSFVSRLRESPARAAAAQRPAASWLPRLQLVSKRPPGEAPADREWHALEALGVLKGVGSRGEGLDEAEAADRLRRSSAQELVDETGRSPLSILLAQVMNLPTGLLLGSSGLSALTLDWLDAAAVLSAVGLNAAIGYQIEHTNEELLASWRRLETGEAEVVRQGEVSTVPVGDLVRGDVIICRAGDLVPADARVIEAHRLRCDEALLTGESHAQDKAADPVRRDAPLAERSSMLYAGTTIVGGHGRAVVVDVGRETEAGKIGQLLAREETPETPLERRLRAFGNTVAGAGLGAGIAAFAAGLLHGRPLRQVVRSGVSLAVAAIPEGLPVVSTAALVHSMQRMRERGMVLRRLVTAETLGAVTVVCADKTGTLTRNEMRVELLDLSSGSIAPEAIRAEPGRIFEHGPTLALAAAVLNSDVEAQEGGNGTQIVGSSTERALIAAAEAAGLRRGELRERFPRLSLRERDSARSYVVTIHDAPGGGRVAFVKGAPEQVLEICHRDLRRRLDKRSRAERLRRNGELAARGLRVLGLAWKLDPENKPAGRDEGYTWIGMVALVDPLRDGAAEAVERAARAGIRTVILTGDQRRTAEAIARAVGLTGEALDGGEVERLLAEDGPAARERLSRAAVLSRVTPADKLAMIHALRAQGEIVAMAGDGINDAPALRAADVGIAIGVRSSDVARQAADVVLENEDLRSILAGIGEGRIVQDNLRRTIGYLLASNLSEVMVVLGAAAIGALEPLKPLQLLWINLLSDTLPALALALEPGEPDVLDRPPGRPDAPLIDAEARWRIVRDGFRMAALGSAALALGGPAAAFATLSAAEIAYAAVCRAPGAPPGPSFLGLVGGAAALQATTLAFPPLRMVFGLPARASLGEFLGFGVGLVAPTLLYGRADLGNVIVGRRRALEPSRTASGASRSLVAR